MESMSKFLFYVGVLAVIGFSIFVFFYEIPSETSTTTKEIKHEIIR